MPYRARPINWSLLLSPTMAGIAASGRSSERLANMILGVGDAVGEGIVRDRQEEESRRRYDTSLAESRRARDQDFSLRSRAMDLREAESLQDQARRAERAALDDANTDDVISAVDRITQEQSLLGAPSPASQQRLQAAVQAAGNPQIAQARYMQAKAADP